ncbi:MAG: sulfatase-like hydrolase/transferase [Deltaproteobacteria bacterium]|nr:sulfatase-like hydrolase/transferase [Deltaproteobacteria bacterium]
MSKTKHSRKWVFLIVGLVVLLAFLFVLIRKARGPALPPPSVVATPAMRAKLPASGIVGKPVTPGPREPNSTNVVLVVVDTERADYLNPYGAERPTSPFLSEMASQGITFTRAFSTAPWTPPAMFSLMTGLNPSEHGITSGTAVGQGEARRVRGQDALPDEATTMAELLKEQGYSTFGINTNYHLNAKYGFAQGFDRFAGSSFTFLPYPNLMVNSLAGEIRGAPKYFLWLHYFDPHFPYRGIAPWFDQWNDSAFKASYQFSEDMTVRVFRKYKKLKPQDLVPPEYIETIYKVSKLLSANQNAISTGTGYLLPESVDDYIKFLVAAYQSELRGVDDAMKEALEKLGVDDNTLLIFTADHGEEIFDHGRLGHRHSVYQELIHIPLIIRLPGKKAAGTVIDTPVSIIDILPTLLDLLDLPIPEHLSGVSLKPLIEGEKIPARPFYCEVKNRVGETRCLVEFPWKVIYHFYNKVTELYNLETDPKEKVDLSAEEPGRADAMRQRLIDWTENTKPRWRATKLKPLSRQELRQLRQMGYIQ